MLTSIFIFIFTVCYPGACTFLPNVQNGKAEVLPWQVVDCDGPDLDCDDFLTWEDAQLTFQACMVQGLGDPYELDRDADNFACEHLENPWN